jgi:hypothetical protein
VVALNQLALARVSGRWISNSIANVAIGVAINAARSQILLHLLSNPPLRPRLFAGERELVGGCASTYGAQA